MLYFPLCRFKHWFSFVVCLKERVFSFLDSFYGQFSDFHMKIRDKMVNNFINLWDMFVSPIMRKRIEFKSFGIVYPVVPQQTNVDDCGVFSMMYMKHWTPRTPIGNLFSYADIDNIRNKLGNELYFGPSNSADKSFVSNFFGDVIDLALKLINPLIEPGEVFPNVNGIHVVIASELCDHHVVGVESTLHHPLALEDLLLHCFEPRLHASGLLRPLNIADVQHPLAHLDRLRVFQHFREEQLNVIFIKKCIFIIKGGLPPKDFLLLVPLRVSTLPILSCRWHLLVYWSVPLLGD
ncbi:ubiquitin-like-specific protease esd4 isoform x1 [Hordeum vulgare]|nr:ubiquitin-like-specific protease esd4 isoform x1 [Hordeum vulgare]